MQGLNRYAQALPEHLNGLQEVLKKILPFTFTHSNQAKLLIDGEGAYRELFKAIEQAKDYVLLQFYIVRNDNVGKTFHDILVKKAQEGVRVYFLYDAWGAHSFAQHYLRSLHRAGVSVSSFHEVKGQWRNRWQLNFRNHRKIVIADGKFAFVGGMNIGDEYAQHKRTPKYWRDTHLALYGPAVQNMQLSFCEDWYWAQRTTLLLNWEVTAQANAKGAVLVLPTGPDKQLQTGVLLITQLINMAKKRLWIATPYFVPDQTILTALELAVLRGVDVRILLPNKADHYLVYWCSFSFYEEMQDSGIQFYRYLPGFMHQKVILVDDDLSSVGTINLDNRSLFINFEITALMVGADFASQVSTMLTEDFKNSNKVKLEEYVNQPYWFKLVARLSRLLAPLL
jgi:cardiolipin synthase